MHLRGALWPVVAAIATAAQPAAAGPSRCTVPDRLIAAEAPLPRTAARVAAGEPLLIVAIGSSSTAGAGASRPDRAYPARLEAELARRFPASAVTVVNKGVGGERASEMLERFEKDVFALAPDLVVWQSGTNSALRGGLPTAFRAVLEKGVAALRRHGADVILMAPQFAPRFDRQPNRLDFVQAMAETAAAGRVVLFRRYTIMKHWIDSGQLDSGAILAPDGLHLNDLSYGCVAELLARQISAGARRETLTSIRRVGDEPRRPLDHLAQ